MRTGEAEGGDPYRGSDVEPPMRYSRWPAASAFALAVIGVLACPLLMLLIKPEWSPWGLFVGVWVPFAVPTAALILERWANRYTAEHENFAGWGLIHWARRLVVVAYLSTPWIAALVFQSKLGGFFALAILVVAISTTNREEEDDRRQSGETAWTHAAMRVCGLVYGLPLIVMINGIIPSIVCG